MEWFVTDLPLLLHVHFSSAGAVIQVAVFKSCEKGTVSRRSCMLLYERGLSVIVCAYRLQQQPLLHADVGVLGNILHHVQCDPVTCLSINAFTYYTAVMSFGM